MNLETYNQKTKKVIPYIFACFVMLFPFTLFAQGLIPDCGEVNPQGQWVNSECGWPHLLLLARNVVTFLIVLSAALAALVFAFAGFVMVTSAGNTSRIEFAKGIFLKVLLGFIFVLGAWLIVYFVTTALVDDSRFILLSNIDN